MAEQTGNRGAPLSAAPPPGKEWWRPPKPPRPSSEMRGDPDKGQPTEQKPDPFVDQIGVRTMIVGSGTSFSGEINSCNRLILEGTVDAKLSNCEDVVIDQGGVFKGQGVTENAAIQGSFEGELVVRKRLVICATGRVSGIVTYGEIEIERGGKISGAIQAAGERGIRKVVRAAAAKALATNGTRQESARVRTDTQLKIKKKDVAGGAEDRILPGD